MKGRRVIERVVAMKTVTVNAERSGKWWVLDAPEAGAVSQCRSLSQADAEMREAIAFQLGLPEDGFVIDVHVVVPEEYKALATQATKLRDQAEEASRLASLTWRRAAKVLADRRMSVRDIGAVMGISHQRAAQLLAS